MLPELAITEPTCPLEVTLLDRLKWEVSAAEVMGVLRENIGDLTDGDLRMLLELAKFARAVMNQREARALKATPLFAEMEVK